jgi:hypothetical protein
MTGQSSLDAPGGPPQDGNADCTALPDIGAFERPDTGCSAPATVGGQLTSVPPTVLPARKDTRAPKPAALKIVKGRLSFMLDEPARVAVTVQRATGKSYKTLRTLKVAVKAGRRSVKLGRLASGRYRVRVVATDAAGNASARATKTLRVRR